MSHTLNLVAGLLAAARNFQAAGRSGAALDLLLRLSRFQQLTPETAEEIHSRLAELYAEDERYKSARRHLAIALTYRPQHAEYQHRMACYIEADSTAALSRAALYYRRAVRGAPDNAECWADYGAYLLNAGRLKAGRAAMRRAFRLASHEPALVGQVTAELRAAGLWDDARQLLRRARFQHRGDKRFAALWQQHQFEELCAAQRDAEPTPGQSSDRPAILPFLRADASRPSLKVDGKIIRLDRAETAEPTLPMPKRHPRHPGNRQSK